MTKRKNRTHKPLAGVGGKVPAKIYRCQLIPSQHVKYLDIAALKKVTKTVIDVGFVKAARLTVPIVAEVRKGMVVTLRPTHCTACTPARRQNASTPSARERAAKAALQKVRELGHRTLRLPMPVQRLRAGLFDFIITILIDWEFCLVIQFDDGRVCYFCTRTRNFCINPG